MEGRDDISEALEMRSSIYSSQTIVTGGLRKQLLAAMKAKRCS